MEFVLGLLAGLAQRFGAQPTTLLAVLVLVVVFAGIGGAMTLGFYYLRSRIAIAEREAVSAQQERQREAEGRERERATLVAEVGASRAQTHQFMSNHLEHDRVEREQLAKVLTQQSEAMRAIVDDHKAHRVEEAARASSLHAQINDLGNIMSEIKGKLT